MIIPSDHWVKDSPKRNRQDYPTLSKLIDRDDDFLISVLMGDEDPIIYHNYLLHHKEN